MPSKKKQFKKIDISDFENVLEKERQEEGINGSLKFKKDTELFVIDKKKQAALPDAEIKYRRGKLSYADKVLGAQDKPSPTINKKRKLSRSAMKLLSRLKAKPAEEPQKSNKIHDIWTEPPKNENEYLADNSILHVPKQQRSTARSSDLHIPVPAPGASYNPTYEAHQDELGEALADELQNIERKERLKRKLQSISTKDFFRPYNPEEDVQKINEEPEPENNQAETSEVAAQRAKTKKEKRKQHERKLKEAAAYEAAIQKKLSKDINNIHHILSEIDTEKQMKEEQKLLKKPKKVKQKAWLTQPKDVLLTDELPKRLVDLPAAGNIVEDQFFQLQKSNLFPVKPPTSLRKDPRFTPKLKETERWSTRMEGLPL